MLFCRLEMTPDIALKTSWLATTWISSGFAAVVSTLNSCDNEFIKSRANQNCRKTNISLYIVVSPVADIPRRPQGPFYRRQPQRALQIPSGRIRGHPCEPVLQQRSQCLFLPPECSKFGSGWETSQEGKHTVRMDHGSNKHREWRIQDEPAQIVIFAAGSLWECRFGRCIMRITWNDEICQHTGVCVKTLKRLSS